MSFSLREHDFVREARYIGVPTRTIVFRHLIPNVASILVIDATLNVRGAILTETRLSFLGIGVQPRISRLAPSLPKGLSLD